MTSAICLYTIISRMFFIAIRHVINYKNEKRKTKDQNYLNYFLHGNSFFRFMVRNTFCLLNKTLNKTKIILIKVNFQRKNCGDLMSPFYDWLHFTSVRIPPVDTGAAPSWRHTGITNWGGQIRPCYSSLNPLKTTAHLLSDFEILSDAYRST